MAVESTGGEPVQMPLSRTRSELLSLAASCAGFVLPGSPADIAPARYGKICEPLTASPDPEREDCDTLLLEHAESTGKPILGICYGLQSLVAWRGGTLVQHLRPMPVNHEAGRAVGAAHSILIVKQSLLASLLTATEAPAEDGFRHLLVNSSHHQAVAVPGEGLAIVARSRDDAVIEALEGRVGRAPILGVQWHPERSTQISSASRAIFAWLVSEAADSVHE